MMRRVVHRLHSVFVRISDTLGRLVDVGLAMLVLTMSAVIFSQVISRYLFNHSLFWSEELGRCLLVWVTFLGASAAYKRAVHARIEIYDTIRRLPGRLGPIAVRCARLVSHGAGLVLFFVMVRYGFSFFAFLKFQQTTSLGVSKQVPFIIVPISGILLLIHAVTFIFEDIAGHSSSDQSGQSGSIMGGS